MQFVKTIGKGFGNLGDNVAKIGTKNADELAVGGAKKLDDIPMKQVNRGLTNVGEEAAEKAAKETAKEAAEKAAKEAAEKAAKEAAEKTTKEVAEKTTKEAADKLTDAAKTNQKLSSKIAKVLKENPGKTLGAALLAAATVAGVILAKESFEKSNNQPLTIINSYATSGGDEGDVTIEYTAASGVTVVDGDSVIVNPPNEQENLLSSGQVSNYFIPTTIYGQTIQVKSIISSSSIIINYPGLVGYAKKGILTLQTTMENRLLDQAEKTVDAAKELTGTVLGPILGPIQKMLGPYLIYAQGCCCCICCLILISIIYKVSKMAK